MKYQALKEAAERRLDVRTSDNADAFYSTVRDYNNPAHAKAILRLLDERDELFAGLHEILTNGFWTTGGNWCVSRNVYDDAQEARDRAEIRAEAEPSP